MKARINCYRHRGREAVAILDGGRPVCQDCATSYEADRLNTGASVMITHNGDPKWLLIPFHKNIGNN